MSKLIRLLHPAFCVPAQREWYGSLLGLGSVVELFSEDDGVSPSPIGLPDELPIKYLDNVERECIGWLDGRTIYEPVRGAKASLQFVSLGDDWRQTATDRLREQIARHRSGKGAADRDLTFLGADEVAGQAERHR